MINETKERLLRSIGVSTPTVLEFLDLDNTLRTITLDCTFNMKTSIQTKTTKFPIEAGFDISDTAIVSPLKFNIAGCISESNIDLTSRASAVAASAANYAASSAGLSNAWISAALSAGIKLAIKGAVSYATSSSFKDGTIMSTLGNRGPDGFFYPKKMMRALTLLARMKRPIFVKTYFNDTDYNNMVIENVTFSQDPKTPDNLVFSMDMTRIRVVTSEVKQGVFLDKSESTVSDPTNSSAVPTKDKGNKTPTDVESETILNFLFSTVSGSVFDRR